MLADLSQTVDRGRVSLRGTIPTVTTSSSLYNFGRQRYLTSKELLAMHGMASRLRTQGLTDGELKQLVGNIMCVTTQVIALTPILRALGILRHVQRPP